MNKRTEELHQSWVLNAEAWIEAVRSQHIESRRLVTDQAIVDVVLSQRPQRALDLGCGEGWLCRELACRNIEMVGIDASPPLIEAARESELATYQVMDFQKLDVASASLGLFDAVVCNFCLLQADLEPVLRSLQGLLRPHGSLVIQTVHPDAIASPEPAISAVPAITLTDGWQWETFESFGSAFQVGMPWFFRTAESWLQVLSRSGWKLEQRLDPRHPQTQAPLSLIFVATPSSENVR